MAQDLQELPAPQRRRAEWPKEREANRMEPETLRPKE